MVDSNGLLDLLDMLRRVSAIFPRSHHPVLGPFPQPKPVPTHSSQEAFTAVLSLAADLPLLTQPSTPLESDHLAFVTSIAHQASFTIGTRLLSTGAAKDVTGVVRVTKGSQDVDEKELLYFVARDGGVTAFERGAGGERS
jgi:hypothetical protein